MSPFLLAAALAPSTELIAFTEPVLFPIPGTAEAREYTAAPKGGAFREAIASWNVEPAQNAALKIQVRAHGTGFTTKWYTLAEWSKDAVGAPRISVEGQKDEHGNVLTDTLRLAKPAERLDVRVTLRTLAEGPRPGLSS